MNSQLMAIETGAAPRGLARWLFASNHRDLGTLYLVFGALMLFVGGGMAMLVRAELFMPGLQILEPDWYNNLITNHGLIMLLGAVLPAATGMAYRMIPPMIGAADTALPRLGSLAFWLTPAGCLLLVLSMVAPALVGGAPVTTGWTLYPPLSINVGLGMDLLIFAIHALDLSAILASINIVCTVMLMRGPGMHWFRLPIFVWSWLFAGLLLIMVLPVLSAAVTMLLFDRHFGTSFFNAAGGGDPVLFQHLFWFFGHPEVYILLLPSVGIMGMVAPTFARKPLFGYRSLVIAMGALSLVGMLVWAHHQYATGMSLLATRFFMVSTILISIPVSLMMLNYVFTLWRGSLSFETPMLFCLAFIVMFTFGGLTGLMLAVVPANLQYHDTYFVVAHFHYTMIPGALFGLYAGLFFWLPHWTGRMYDERLGRLFFWCVVVSMNCTFFPQHFLGLAGMPRRIADYNLIFADLNAFSSVAAMLLGLSHLLLIVIVVKTLRSGAPVRGVPWDGAAIGTSGLEWSEGVGSALSAPAARSDPA